jgi:thioredoxin reductase
MEMSVVYDVVIVGGSFAGLSAALQIARARRRVLVVDSGRPRNRFADSAHGFFAQDGRAPSQVLTSARAQLLAYPEVEIVDGHAESAERDGVGFAVTLSDGARFDGRRLILATGITDVFPPVPGLEDRWGQTVLHCPYCHGYELKGDRIGVLATGPAAPELAILVGDWGRVTLFTQGLDPDPQGFEKFLARGGGVETARVLAAEGDDPDTVSVRLEDGRRVELDALFLATELRLCSDLAEQLGCRLADGQHGPIVATDEHKQTSVPGVYAAGDMARISHNATLASADGVTAGIAAHHSLLD